MSALKSCALERLSLVLNPARKRLGGLWLYRTGNSAFWNSRVAHGQRAGSGHFVSRLVVC